MSIHQRIKDRRIALGLSMEALAKLVGVSSWQTIQQWEKEGGTAPTRKRFERVAEALDVRGEWLATGKEPMQYPSGRSDLQIDVAHYVRSEDIVRLLQTFTAADEEGRKMILDFAAVAASETGAIDFDVSPRKKA